MKNRKGKEKVPEPVEESESEDEGQAESEAEEKEEPLVADDLMEDDEPSEPIKEDNVQSRRVVRRKRNRKQ